MITQKQKDKMLKQLRAIDFCKDVRCYKCPLYPLYGKIKPCELHKFQLIIQAIKVKPSKKELEE